VKTPVRKIPKNRPKLSPGGKTLTPVKLDDGN